MQETSILIPVASVFGLILLSAFFSGSETGLTSISRAKIHKLKMEGSRRAITVSKLHEDKERLIGAILLGNNVVNIAASAIATALAIKLVGEGGVVYATAIMTVLVLVFAEVLPKTYAVRHAEQVALAVAPALSLITRLLSPFTMAIHSLVNRMISLLSIMPSEQMSGVDALRGAVEMYHEEGNMLTDDKDMLSGIFDLGDTEVEEIMMHRSDMVSINIDEPFDRIIAFAANSLHSRIPLWEGVPDNIVGILHTKDLFKAIHTQTSDAGPLDVRTFMREPWFVPETTNLKYQLKAFQEKQKHIALVVDEFGSVVGLITLEDIIEEVVGDIDDEHDKPTRKRIRKMKDGTYNIDGSLSLRELNRELGWTLSDEDATTLAGYVMAAAQRIPETDEIFEIGEFMFKILKREANQITRIKARKISDQPPAIQSSDDEEESSKD